MLAQPQLLLLGRCADGDGIAAEEGREHGRGDAKVDARHGFANAIDVEGAAAHAAVVLRHEQELNAQLVRVAHVANDVERTFVALVQLDQHFVGQAFLGEFFSDFKLSFSVFLVIMAVPLFAYAAAPFASRIFSVSAGRNSRMSSTMPTSATWKMGAFGFLLTATMNGLPFSAGQVLERTADAHAM